MVKCATIHARRGPLLPTIKCHGEHDAQNVVVMRRTPWRDCHSKRGRGKHAPLARRTRHGVLPVLATSKSLPPIAALDMTCHGARRLLSHVRRIRDLAASEDPYRQAWPPTADCATRCCRKSGGVSWINRLAETARLSTRSAASATAPAPEHQIRACVPPTKTAGKASAP